MPNLELTPKTHVSSFRKIAIGTWATAYDPSVYGSLEVRMDDLVVINKTQNTRHKLKPEAKDDAKKDPNAKKEDLQLAAALNHLKGLPIGAPTTTAANRKPSAVRCSKPRRALRRLHGN